MNGENEPETNIMTEPAPAPAPAVEIFRCKKCGREFGKAQALATHEIRAHKKFWSTNVKRPGEKPAHWRAVKKKPAAKSRYQHYRDKYRAQGLNAKGQPYKTKTGRPARLTGSKRAQKTCPVCQLRFKTRST